jgi:hypothetical protein
VARLRRALAGLPLPTWDDGRIRLTVDVSNWLRPVQLPAGNGCSAPAMPGSRGTRR